MNILDVLASPWAILPEVYHEMLGIYEGWLRGEYVDIAAVEKQIGRPLKNEQKRYEVVNGVAVIPIEGVIARKMNLMTDISGGASIQLITADFREALGRADVKAILLAIDSPGGTVDGTMEFAAEVFAARGVKPVAAIGDGLMASAAYWIGSAAGEVWLGTETSQTGSIGVITLHRDVSKYEEQIGVKTTVLTAGKYKGIANQYEPLSQEGRAVIQEHLDYIYTLFVNNVAKMRGVDTQTALARMADGRVFIGRQAVEAGLAEGIMTKEMLITRLAGPSGEANISKPGAKARIQGGRVMEGDVKVAGAPLTVETVRAQHPEIMAALIEEGRITGVEEGRRLGVEAERIRIQAVEAQSMPGHEALIASLKFDGKTTGPEAAVQVLSAEKANNARLLKELETKAPDPVKASLTDPSGGDARTPEEKWEAEWNDSEAIRTQFGNDKGAFLALKKYEVAKK
jgi:signal peptide peptidase SppA